MSEEKENIILRTEEVNEILADTPKWILRWGISVIFILIVAGIFLSYFIQYPDILIADMTLTTKNPPVDLIAKSIGKLTHLLVKNNQLVKNGEVIAVIENSGNYKDIISLSETSVYLQNILLSGDTIPELDIRNNLMVGNLTPNYLLLLKSSKDLAIYKETSSYNKQIKLLKKDLTSYYELLNKYKQQEFITKQQLVLSETDYNRDKTLFENKVISAREFDIKKKDYLGALNIYESAKITISNTSIQINAIEKNILKLQLEDYKEQELLKNEFQQNLKSLISEIDKWKQLYIIESPVDGKISFFNIWSVNQNINTGEHIFSVIPSQKQQFIGKCSLPSLNSGKLAIGQNVNIKLDNYPYNEHGILSGVVKNISLVPEKDHYAIDIELKNGLTSSYNKTLAFKENMKGKAEIITQNLSVMERIFFNFKKMIDRK